MLWFSLLYTISNFESPDKHGSLGSIPLSLFTDQHKVRAMGFATLLEHARMLFNNYQSLSGTDYRHKMFMFDALSNVALNGNDSRLIMHRGLSPSAAAISGFVVRNGTDSLIGDVIDSRAIISELSASQKLENYTLFFSVTVNQSKLPGLQHIKEWLDSSDWQQNFSNFHHTMSKADVSEIENQVNQAAAGVLLRNWLEIRKRFIDYLINSSENVMLTIIKLFARDEYQDAGKGPANLSHIHMLICTKEKIDNPEGKKAIEHLIRGFPGDLIRDCEILPLIDQGWLHDKEHYWDVMKDANMNLVHTCENGRCMRRMEGNKLACRFKNIYFESPNPAVHSYREDLPSSHLPQAMELLRKHKVVAFLDDSMEKFKGTHPSMCSIQHFPPILNPSLKTSPAPQKPFIFFRSNMNIQCISAYATARYIEKYCAKIDENNSMTVSVAKDDPSKYLVTGRFLHNTKIASSAYHESKHNESRNQKKLPIGRGKSLFEIEHLVQGEPFTRDTNTYVHVSTRPMEERRGFERVAKIIGINNKRNEAGKSTIRRIKDSFDNDLFPLKIRKNLCKWRQFTKYQVIVIKDHTFSHVTTDKITTFSLRPPELLFVDSVELYFSCFDITTIEETNVVITNKLNESMWLDGLGRLVKVRCGGISAVMEQLTTCTSKSQTMQF